MGIAIGDLLMNDFFKDFEVVAGKKGLHREIQGFAVFEAPDCYRWTVGKELIFSSGYVLSKEPDSIKKAFEEDAWKKTAGFIIKRGRFLNEIQELSEDEKEVYSGIGREFMSLIETTDMQKVYKMPILYSFYNGGDIRLAVTEEQVLVAWKKFFDNGTNWKDFSADISYDAYKGMTDKQHLSKAKSMPIKFLKASGKGFFVEKEGYVLAIREDLENIIENESFKKHFKDILEYRTMEYYRRRYQEKK